MDSVNETLPSGGVDEPPTAAESGPGASAEPPVVTETEPAEPAQATSEANIAAVDPNASDLPPTITTEEKPVTDEMDVDMKAAETDEGAVSGVTIVAPDSGSNVDTTQTLKKGGNQKRRSSTGVPEHKSKKLSRKKSMPTLNLNAKPGDYYFARLKGHAPWPAIVCDEDMLPEALLGSRPVTAQRPDGSYREDFMEGGKNAKDRTYPVMFLATNEFAWVPNVDLNPLDFEEVKNATQGKKGKKLWEAYEIAQEEHDLDHFKSMLTDFEKARQQEEEEYAARQAEIAEKEAEKEAKRAERAAKKEAKPKRKSKAADNDVDMEEDDADNSTPKSAKKRKKAQGDADGDETKPAKTPKTSKSLKLSLAKNANGDSAKSKAKGPKSKPVPKDEPYPIMTEAEKLEKKEKSVLFLRHKLQKGFLQNSAPQESEMETMATHFASLEQYRVLEVSIIRNTKIHKVLKAIIKLNSVPMDDEYDFKRRSNDLLQGWNKILSDESESVLPTTKETSATNGASPGHKADSEKPEEPKTEETKVDDAKAKDTPIDASAEEESRAEDSKAGEADADLKEDESAKSKPEEPATAPVETSLLGNDAKDEADNKDVESAPKVDGDVAATTTEAKDQPSAVASVERTIGDVASAQPSASATASDEPTAA